MKNSCNNFSLLHLFTIRKSSILQLVWMISLTVILMWKVVNKSSNLSAFRVPTIEMIKESGCFVMTYKMHFYLVVLQESK